MMELNEINSIIAAAGVQTGARSLYSTDRGDVLAFDGPGGDAAIGLWRRLRDAVPRTGFWPVLLGAADEAPEMAWVSVPALAERFGPRVRATLDAASQIRLPEWFELKHRERAADFQEDEFDPEAVFAPEGEWPCEADSNHDYLTPFDIRTRKPCPSLAYALIPTTSPWETPAFLNAGGWNECPEPAEQCAVMKYWHGRYGAEVVATTGSVIEMRAARPPTDWEGAMTLAREQYEYCPDIVEQGTQTLARLGASLLNGSVWFFWWD